MLGPTEMGYNSRMTGSNAREREVSRLGTRRRRWVRPLGSITGPVRVGTGPGVSARDRRRKAQRNSPAPFAKPPLTGVLTLLVTPPPSLRLDELLPTAPALAIGSGCSVLGDPFLPVIVFALDLLLLIKLLRKEERGLVGLASAAGVPPGDPFGETRVMGALGGRGI